MYIPGLCKLWAMSKQDNRQGWFEMSYGARTYDECEQLRDNYEEQWGGWYSYQIVSACSRPVLS